MARELNRFIEEELARRRLSRRAASERAGLSPGTLSSLLSKDEGTPDPDTVIKLAHYFGVPEQTLLTLAGYLSQPDQAIPSFIDTLRILNIQAPIAVPIVDQIAHAGSGVVAMDYIYLPPRPGLQNRRLVGVRVRGTCMEPLIHEGDLAIIDLDRSPVIGNIVVVSDEEEIMVRKLVMEGGRFLLRSENGECPDQEVGMARVVGVVIEITRVLA